MSRWICLAAVASWAASGISTACRADVQIVVAHRDNDSADGSFDFENVRQPTQNDAAAKAEFVVLSGRRDPNGGDVDKLHDGRLPVEADEPAQNFFFNAGDDGGRLLVDLGQSINIEQINTYSWHPGSRGPQVYKIYASDGAADNFNRRPDEETDPTTCGWSLLGEIDTSSSERPNGGQCGVAITASEGLLGSYRFLLFAVSATELQDPFGNTFFSEIRRYRAVDGACRRDAGRRGDQARFVAKS